MEAFKKPTNRSMIHVALEITYLYNSLLKIKKLSKHRKEMQEDKVRM